MNSWFRESLNDILNKNRHVDCKFIIKTPTGNKEYACHKLIFSCASKSFSHMLYGNYDDPINNKSNVRLTDVDPQVFDVFRKYVYSYDVDIIRKADVATIVKLAEFGNKYSVESIRKDCVDFLKYYKQFSDMNELLQIFQCAHMINSSELLGTASIEIERSMENLCNYSTIYQFNKDVFKHFIQIVAGKLSESERFNLIQMYVKLHKLDAINMGIICGNANIRKDATELDLTPNDDYITDLVNEVDFENFSPQEFYVGPGKSNLLTLQQKYENLYKIAMSCANLTTHSIKF